MPENTSVDRADVSEEFVDLDARINNKRRLETELLELLHKRDGELKDVIAVKQELFSVREESERMEGRLRFLRDQVSLTTITITAREDRNYTPQQAPTFTTRIGGAWDNSLLAMREAGENLVIALLALAPWAAVACSAAAVDSPQVPPPPRAVADTQKTNGRGIGTTMRMRRAGESPAAKREEYRASCIKHPASAQRASP